MSVANVKDGYLDLATVKTMPVSEDEIGRYKVQNGDVLFTEGGDADKVGRGTVWRNEMPLCLHQNHIFAVRPNQNILYSDFLASFAASNCGKRYFLSAAKQTTNLASINASQLKLLPVPLPMPREQQTIVAILDGVERLLPCPSHLAHHSHCRPPSAPPKAPADRPPTSRLPEFEPGSSRL